ncbi:hypothetical protein AVEN_106679-1 [Araneus ventricosus]|uniref:Uncharacterized protein n=1 Tax=Araneus ventricosus TaxID=182803 RepID=A0A4Y2WMD6_ARAVE|nr:hypothetical protein AVEN_106679-1 [Araneus ventricosus]
MDVTKEFRSIRHDGGRRLMWVNYEDSSPCFQYRSVAAGSLDLKLRWAYGVEDKSDLLMTSDNRSLDVKPVGISRNLKSEEFF